MVTDLLITTLRGINLFTSQIIERSCLQLLTSASCLKVFTPSLRTEQEFVTTKELVRCVIAMRSSEEAEGGERNLLRWIKKKLH